MRPKADGTTVQLSYNTGPYFDLGAAGAGAFPRLDQVLDPDIPATDPPTNRVKAFSMVDHSLAFVFSGEEAEECFVITSAEPTTPGAAGSLLLLRAAGVATEKNPLRIETRNAFAFTVASTGKVAIGAETGQVAKLNIYHTNVAGASETIGALHASVSLGPGHDTASMGGSEINTSDAGATTGLLALNNLTLNLNRESSGLDNTGLICTNLRLESNLNTDTGTLRNLSLTLQVHGSTLSTWEALRIWAPGTLLGGAITTRRAIVTDAGSLDFTLGESELATIYRYSNTPDMPTQLDFRRARGTVGSPSDITGTDTVGRLMFYGRLASGTGGWQAHGYLHSYHDSSFGGYGARVALGAGDFGLARVELLETGAGLSAVQLYAGTHYLQIQTSGFQFSHGTTGSIYYKAGVSPDNGWFTNLDIDPLTDEGRVLTVANVSGVMLPRWITPVGGETGGTPGTPPGSLQFNDAGVFGGVASSLVTGANVTLGGSLTVQSGLNRQVIVDPTGASTLIRVIEYNDAAGSILRFERAHGTAGAPGNMVSGDDAGRVEFHGRIAGAPTLLGYLYGGYDSTDGGVIALATGQVTPRTFVALGGTTDTIVLQGFNGSIFTILSVTPSGLSLSGGTNGGLYFKNTSGFFATTSAPPAADRLLFWDNSAGAYAWLTAGDGLLITDTTLTATGATTGTSPGGSSLELQFNEAGVFGGLDASEVSAANLRLGGVLTVQVATNTSKQIISNPTGADTLLELIEYSGVGASSAPILRLERGRGSGSSPVNINLDDIVGALEFQGRIAGVMTTVGYLQGSYRTTDGGVIALSTGQATPRTFVALGTATDTITLQGFNGSTFSILTVTPSGTSLSGGSTNGVYFKNSSGYITTTSSPPAADRIFFWDTSATAYAWLTVGSGLDLTGTTLTATAAPGGGTPEAPVNTLQFNEAGAFGAMPNSLVSGANLTLGGTLTLDAAGVGDQSIALSALATSDTKITFTEYRTAATPILLQFDRAGGTVGSPTNIATGDNIAELRFRGRVGSFTQLGYLRGRYTTDGGSVELGAGATSGAGSRFVATVNAGLGLWDAGGVYYFTVSGSGIAFSHGTTGSLYYRSSSGFFTPLTVGSSSEYLKGGTTPTWGGIDAGHINAGTLPLARGGTGAGLIDPNADRLLFWDDSSGAVTWLTAGSGLTISGTTMTASGSASAPGGSPYQLQYNSAGVLAGVTGLEIATAGPPNLILGGGYLQLAAGLTSNVPDKNQEFFISATTAAATRFIMRRYANSPVGNYIQFDRGQGTEASKLNLADDDAIGEIRFYGYVGSLTQRAYIQGRYSSTDGGTLELGTGPTMQTGTRFIATQNAGLGLYDAGGNSFFISPSGFEIAGPSSGSTGAIYYKSSIGRFQPLTVGSSSQYLKGGTIPGWGSLSASDVTSGVLGLFYGGTGASLSDPNADRIMFWDDSAGAVTWLTAGTGLTISGTTMTAVGGAPTGFIAGSKALSDGILTDLFSVSFNTFDHIAGGGELHLVFVAKQLSGTTATQVYRRKITFIAGHNGSTNTSMFNAREDAGSQASAASSSQFSQIMHAINFDGGQNIATAIPANPNSIATNAITYKIMVNSDLSFLSQLTCYYHIIHSGEITITPL